MEDDYEFTVPLDDIVAYDSPVAESRLLNLDTNTEIVDVCQSIQHSGDQMEDYHEKQVVLDSDDEGLEQNEAEGLVNEEPFPFSRRLFGRHATGLLKPQRIRAGHFRRLDNKVSAHRFLHLNSARSARWVEEGNAGRTCLDNDNRYQDHPFIMDHVVSKSADQKSISPSAEKFHEEPAYVNMVRESPTKESSDERKLSSHKSNAINLKKDANYVFEHAKLNYIESPELAEAHSKALDFVNHYLAVSDLGSCKGIEARKTDRIKSPPSLRSKGSQSLARRVNVGSTATKSMIFDWTEKHIVKGEYTSPRKINEPIFGLLGDDSGYLSINQEYGSVNLQKEKIPSLNSKEKLPGNISSPNNLDTNSMDLNDIEKIGSNSEICIAHDSMELDEQFDAGLLRHNVEKDEQVKVTPDAFEFGLDTQIAAEAMEALVHAAPPMFDACFAHQGSDNTFVDSYNSVNRKSKSKQSAKPKEAFVGWRKKDKRSKSVKISTVPDKNVFSSLEKRSKKQRTVAWSLRSENLMTEKLLTRKDLNCRNTGIGKNRKCGVSTRITVHQEQHRERDSLIELQKDNCFPESIGCNQDGRRSKETTCIRSNSPPKRRKMSSFHDDVHKVGVRGNCLKLNSDSSFQVTTDTDKNLSKLNPWIHPKGKRTRQYVARRSIRSINQCSPCVVIENNAEKCPKVNEEASKRVAGLLVYTRGRQFSSAAKDLRSSLERAGDSTSPAVKHNAFSIEFNTAKSSKQLGKSDDGHFPPSVYTSATMKSDVLSNGNCKTLEVFEGTDRFKQSSRSPLMKELTRLGYTESLPDFLPKDSRRRRAMEKCCILFSQNLETSTLKQQKKIVARLGFSVASCCSDATHFVTNKFVRTKNMLEAIALGKLVVTHLWLECCEQAGYVIDEKSYILRDEKKEKEIGFSMPVSLIRARQRPLLKDLRVFITPSVKPSVDAISCLVKSVHGQTVQNILSVKRKNKAIPDDLLILSCEEDYKICVPFLEKGASIYNSELLLNGIVTQKLEYKRYNTKTDLRMINERIKELPYRNGNKRELISMKAV
ncbi:hypothetical protein BUALT_Bualt02G0227500 [Buddleja alternifolia]|uniref:BRCT domain-containing protein n=1 Tax=Buddleja alternifolia TaxID=168488 RepID=A0AAV6Y6Q5_9LAMI|nr:hypothetical protein BUALT_Bualt02G0227500 [Buddleja alternifolia]